ncbi:MAG: glycosyltransferase family 4 protein, partial [Gammaproteobacteria bacterium]|nr:glycosyltransferase family 4 protein [Gammaproteobacteria bacterium]
SHLSRWSRLVIPSPLMFRRMRQFPKLAVGSLRMFLGLTGTASLIREILLQHNISLISAYHLLGPGIVGSWMSDELSIPMITTVFGEIYANPEIHKKYISEVLFTLSKSRRILSCSNHCAESFKLLGLSPCVETIYYGIDTNRFVPIKPDAALCGKLGINCDDQVIIFVGRMVREMGLHVLLRALPEVLCKNNKTKCIIIGTRGELTKDALKMARIYQGRVIVLPDVPAQDLPSYYTIATLAVAPSINARACLGLAIAEAMAVGKPVIGSRVGGTAEVVVDGITGLLVPPENTAALAKAILQLIDDTTALDQMGKHGRERVELLFDKEQTNRRMEQIFIEALS